MIGLSYAWAEITAVNNVQATSISWTYNNGYIKSGSALVSGQDYAKRTHHTSYREWMSHIAIDSYQQFSY